MLCDGDEDTRALCVGQERYVKRKKACFLSVCWAGTLCEEEEGLFFVCLLGRNGMCRGRLELCLCVGQERYVKR